MFWRDATGEQKLEALRTMTETRGRWRDMSLHPDYLARTFRTWDGVNVSLVGRQDLIARKRASGRPQDLVDADMLERG